MIGSLAAIAVAAVVYFSFIRPRWHAPAEIGPEVPAAVHRSRVESAWEAVPMVDLSASLPASGDIDALISADPVIPRERLAGLAQSIREQLVARAGAPDAYAALIDAERGTRWATPADARAWDSLSLWFEGSLRRPLDDRDLRACLGVFLDDLFANHGARLVAAGVNTSGFRCFVFNVRTREQIVHGVQRRLDPSERDYWLRSTSAQGITFRVPIEPLEQILARDGIATVAMAIGTVRNSAGEHYNLALTWHWNPRLPGWVCESATRKGWSGVAYR
ncbi:MAG: hypothetical protein AB7K52_10835 [Phycisphaerales bacterium]